LVARAQQPRSASQWTIYITNDNCPDYTWGFTEEQTRERLRKVDLFARREDSARWPVSGAAQELTH
jgi:hypothetical protein